MSTTWPLWLRRLIQETTIVFAQAYEVARQRTLGNPSSYKRLMAERHEALLDANLCKREIAVLRRNRESLPHQKRPHYSPRDRFEILQIMKLRQWSLQDTADHFVLHYNTVWNWTQAWKHKENVGLFFGRVPWNRISEGIRWAVHELRRLCAEAEFGTRSIAMQLIRAGHKISRSSVQRILREKKPAKPPEPVAPEKEQESVTPQSILRPACIRRTYHLDFTTFDFLFVRFYIAAVIDGFSRKLLALKVFPDAPTTAMILSLLRKTFGEYGSCRFLVTDHGCQFRKRFKDAIKNKFGVTLIKGRVRRACAMNGKVERLFRTLKAWQKLKLLFMSERSIQKKLDVFRKWYDTERPMYVLGMKTPEETWNGTVLDEPVLTPERDPIKPAICVTKKSFEGDPLLPVFRIDVVGLRRRYRPAA
jgi:transposase InsO family protein